MRQTWWWSHFTAAKASVGSLKIVTHSNWLVKVSQENQFHSTLSTIPTDKDKLITDLKIGDCVDAMGHAQIKFALEKKIIFLT